MENVTKGIDFGREREVKFDIYTVEHEKFPGFFILVAFAGSPQSGKNEFPPKKIGRNLFPSEVRGPEAAQARTVTGDRCYEYIRNRIYY